MVLAIVPRGFMHREGLDRAVQRMFSDDAALRSARIVVVDLQDIGAASESAQFGARKCVGLGRVREDEVFRGRGEERRADSVAD